LILGLAAAERGIRLARPYRCSRRLAPGRLVGLDFDAMSPQPQRGRRRPAWRA
jgi:hypothetical protein